jgi:hypothetical protein
MKIGVKTATSCVHKTFFALKCEEKCCSPCGYFSTENGITLIALLITIIIMLILAGVTINITLNGGLFGQAQNAVTETEIAQIKEQIQVDIMNSKMKIGKYRNLSSEELAAILSKYGTVTYDGTKIKGLKPTGKDYEIPIAQLYDKETTTEPVKIPIYDQDDLQAIASRSEERRVGKECRNLWSARWWA